MAVLLKKLATEGILLKKCNKVCGVVLYSSFTPPERKDVKTGKGKGDMIAVEGRENPEVFSPEYVAPQVMTSWHKNKLFYKLNRLDCLRRRQNIKIPEFYPGSILGVTYSDPHAPGGTMRFVGRCLFRDGFGIGSYFNLRNVIEDEAQEMEFQMYDPMILKFELLKQEKWVDTDLRYLRDCDPSHCQIDFDILPEAPLPTSVPIPLFKGKVKLRDEKLFWSFKYHRAWPRPYNLYIEEYLVTEDVIESERFKAKTSWMHYDICRHHDFIDEKKNIMKEMKINKNRLMKRKTNKDNK